VKEEKREIKKNWRGLINVKENREWGVSGKGSRKAPDLTVEARTAVRGMSR
jgi:hypothetical protein